jgi:hypothetical protein
VNLLISQKDKENLIRKLLQHWIYNSWSNYEHENEYSSNLCPNSEAYSKNWYLDETDCTRTYGLTRNGSSLKLVFVKEDSYSTNIGSYAY